jgi:CxxC motif-containing protein (DUF1111 family)
MPAPATAPVDSALIAEGAADFSAELSPDNGLGPLFNGRSCVACHSSPTVGGTGGADLGVVLRVGRLVDGSFDPLVGQGGPVSRAHSIQELGYTCALQSGIPAGANVTSVRAAPQLYRLGPIDQISDDTILQGAATEPEAVRGRPNIGTNSAGQQAIGRFGWKADTVDLQMFVAGALRTEEGVTNPFATEDMLPALPAGASPCAGQSATPKDDGRRVQAISAFVASLPAPARGDISDPTVMRGADLFQQTGCAAARIGGRRRSGGSANALDTFTTGGRQP